MISPFKLMQEKIDALHLSSVVVNILGGRLSLQALTAQLKTLGSFSYHYSQYGGR